MQHSLKPASFVHAFALVQHKPPVATLDLEQIGMLEVVPGAVGHATPASEGDTTWSGKDVLPKAHHVAGSEWYCPGMVPMRRTRKMRELRCFCMQA